MASNPTSTDASLSEHTPHSRLWHGAAYYPELWPDIPVAEELDRIREAGLSVVRIGEFAWSKMEPREGAIDLTYFHNILDCVENSGLKAVFGTPTVTPPVWLTYGHPERCLHDVDGRPMSHGGRQHLAIDEPFVRERCAIIVGALARALGKHPALIAWQIDNEFKCDVDGDFSPSARQSWTNWLRERYKTVDRLNELWGTGVWSQEYQDFAQVPAPVKCSGLHSASLQTAWKRFTRDRIADFANEQIRIIRRHSDRPITHNAGIFFQTDPVKITQGLDFVSFDHYADHSNYHRMVLNYDFWRNTNAERRFWVMETSSGHNGSLLGFHKPHPPEFLKAEAMAAYALGATAFCYWVWRQQRTGAELAHGCLMQAWDSPAMGMQAAQAVESARRELEPQLSGKHLPRAQTALMWSDTGRIMLQVEPHNGLHYSELMEQWSKDIRALGLHLDIIPEHDDLQGRKLLLTPFMPALPEAVLRRATEFVRQGGIWISGPLTGGRTMEHSVPTHAGLGDLERLAGIRTVHSYPLFESGTLGEALGQSFPLTGWAYLFESAGAEIVGRLSGGPTPGLGFLSENCLGKGKIVVLGAQPEPGVSSAFVRCLVDHYCREADVGDRFNVSEGTLVAPWEDAENQLLVCINLGGEGGTVEIPATGEVLRLEPYECRCLSLAKAQLMEVG